MKLNVHISELIADFVIRHVLCNLNMNRITFFLISHDHDEFKLRELFATIWVWSIQVTKDSREPYVRIRKPDVDFVVRRAANSVSRGFIQFTGDFWRLFPSPARAEISLNDSREVY